MGTKIFGVGIGTIILIVAVVFIVRKWGGSIPGVKNIS